MWRFEVRSLRGIRRCSIGNAATGAYVFELVDADDVILSDLVLTGAQYGVYASGTSDSDNLQLLDIESYGHTGSGVYLLASNDGAQIIGGSFHDNGTNGTGIYLAGDDSLIDGAVTYGTYYGILVYGAGHEIRNVEAYGNTYGIWAIKRDRYGRSRQSGA